MEKYSIKEMLNLIKENSEVISVNEMTEGAACTVLLAKKSINKDEELMHTV